MILLLGGNGYVGHAFQRLFKQNNVEFRTISRADYNYADRDTLISLIRETQPEFLINSAGYTGKPNVDACEIYKADCLLGNAVLPAIIREACEATKLAWGHVSSGCIYTGRNADGSGFKEIDAPNFCFRTNNCSFYSGCKAIGEEALADADNIFLWRLRIPFNHLDGPRNYLSKLINYDRLLDAENSISHLDEFAACCWASWQQRIPFGTYNVTNTGSVTARQVVELIKKELRLEREFSFFESEDQFMQIAAKTPRSNCVMDNSKLTDAGIEISSVEDAIIRSLRNWQTVSPRGSAFSNKRSS